MSCIKFFRGCVIIPQPFAGPSDDIPVKVSGNVKSGFEAEFEPREAGVHTVLVEYNGVAVGGTPFYSKVHKGASFYDVRKHLRTEGGFRGRRDWLKT